MDAVKFVKERRRMFDVTGEYPKYNLFSLNISAEDVVKEVEEWSAAHPKKKKKTRQDAFLEHYPEAVRDGRGVLYVCPMTISADHRNSKGGCKSTEKPCGDCRKEFWMQEVE